MAKICLVCSSGGHFLELISLLPLWEEHERFWVTFRGMDTESALQEESVHWAYQPTNRSVVNCLRNFFLAWKILRREKPDIVFSSGAGVSVPFIYAGRMLGVPCLYLESLTRVQTLSLSAKLVYPVVDVLLVQWPKLAARYKRARFEGRVA